MKKFLLKLKQSYVSLFNKNKKLLLVTTILICVIVVAFVFSLVKPKPQNVESNTSNFSSIDDSYEQVIETKIKSMLLSIDEIKSANVMVACETTVIKQYLKNTNQTTTKSDNSTTTTLTEDVVFEKTGSSNTPIVVSTKMPKIVGVWIIINTVSASTRLAIINSICSVLNINESCISILQER